MLRNSATRLILRNTQAPKLPVSPLRYSTIASRIHPVAPLPILRNKRPQPSIWGKSSSPGSILFVSTNGRKFDKIDKEAERKIAEQTIKPTPESISTSSSVRHVFEESQAPPRSDDAMTKDLKADLNTVKDTFSLKEVPRESLYLGLAGVLPYAATSISTVILTYNINNEYSFGTIFAPDTARYLLDLIVPMQIGYGAVVSLQSLDLLKYCLTQYSLDNFFPRGDSLGSRIRRLWRP